MRKRNKRLLIELIRPPVLFVGLVVKTIYGTMFGWWLGPWLQRKADRSLGEDVRANLPFLFPKGSVVERRRIRVLSFAYAAAEIEWENLLFSFTREREGVNVLVASRHAPNLSYELGPVIAALENKRCSDRYAINDLRDAANLLQPHLQALNTAFSEGDFPTIKQKLW
jgi:hypothetical protein